MAFKSNAELEGRVTGTRVRLRQNVSVLGGVFERGTEMTVIGEGPRGLDLVDDHGNHLLETSILGDFYEVIK